MEAPERTVLTEIYRNRAQLMPVGLIKQPWHVIVAKGRIDSFNQALLVEELRHAREAGHRLVALDLHSTRFLSLSAIRFLIHYAKDIVESGGFFALLKPSEKTQRHFGIYASLANILIYPGGDGLNVATIVELRHN